MDDKVLTPYAKEMTTREIVAMFKELYGADVSASLISRILTQTLKRLLSGSLAP